MAKWDLTKLDVHRRLDRAREAMALAVAAADQPHYGSNDTELDNYAEAIEIIRVALAEIGGAQ